MSKNYFNKASTSYNPPQYSNSSCKPNPNDCCIDDSYVVGNSVDFTIDKCDSEIKADVTVAYRDTVRVWGQIRDCQGNPIPYAYLKLIKCTSAGYFGVAHTISDCLGFYQFDICPCNDGSSFRLLVGKASVGGTEREVSNGIYGTNCNPCNDVVPCNCN
ncbi:MAG: hypothetical protein ACRC2K_03045 [Clostridium sp.]